MRVKKTDLTKKIAFLKLTLYSINTKTSIRYSKEKYREKRERRRYKGKKRDRLDKKKIAFLNFILH